MTRTLANSPWTPARIATLQGLLTGEHTARQIAERMGLSRGAVLGRVRRMGLADGLAPQPVYVRTPPMPKPPPAPRLVIEPPKPKPPVIGLSVSILALTSGMCRWPTGEGEHTFCGLPWAGDHGPYCTDHKAIAYVRPVHRVRPPKERTQSRFDPFAWEMAA